MSWVMERSGSFSRRRLFAIVAATSLAVAPVVLEAEAKSGLPLPSQQAWVVICATAGNFYLNLMTGERRSAPDDQDAPCDNSACHSSCRRRQVSQNAV